jgi:Protein of unknown function (DUF4238)
MTARNHHHVSRFYLGGFAGPFEGYRKPMLFVTDMKERWQKPLSPRNVAFVKDFHRIDVDGYEPDALESSIGSWEGEASGAFKRIIRDRSISNPDDRNYLLNFMTLLSVKNPRHRERFRQAYEQLVKRTMDLATATPERWASEMKRMKAAGAINEDAADDYERMRQFIDTDRYKVNLTTNFHLALELDTYKHILQYLARRKWILFRAPPGKTCFITSDHPICLMWSDPGRRRQFKGPGHGVPETQVLFPISNELAVIGAFEAAEREIDTDEETIAKINGSIAYYADRQIYSSDGSFIYWNNDRMMRGADLLDDLQRNP